MIDPQQSFPYRVTDRNLALELVRVTEAAAIASSEWTGRGKKNEADGAAVQAMRLAFDTVAIDGVVTIGEGEMDEAPMLYIGEKVGSGGPGMDIAVDPLEGTNLCAKSLPNAMTVVALAERGKFLHAPDIYMEKIVVGPDLPEGVVDLDSTIEANLRSLARAQKREVSDLVLCALDRERHEEMIAKTREAGARVRLLTDGDVAAAIATCLPGSGVDIYAGSGGAPEGVLAAAAVRCVNGQMQGRLLFEDDTQIERAREMAPGLDPSRRLGLHDMAAGHVLFCATGVTSGDLLRGVERLGPSRARTHSLVMRSKSGTVRFMETHHNFIMNPPKTA
ncbi:class II fructose-bisphosphatase [Gluconobacter wancherniae]|uniref:Fructose-1,6-bisphosphatase n=1 Tax=Gluconobacter wancherniae NBRC 103581 TaxID=656744 RepID=A0A511B0Y5_9PROT|nr:class II fructose-bisphosphatase [Gluconobacter wancherniae]MBF0854057.1 class II fructose-bisphosphatase [Gluconobacter wancherniae]MBS1062443.1 class II fructose-bisphosphatase [Gluconobacter wancherniae]MBS1088829.1 class II fructose-bisphosphatase [Gluconobacter wancherniae]MBS1095501.1 class II fructose-bisphosphatase [Gluconobacter wancherniae]GBD57113.1 fructose-1,6-bisphosphatase [Gluconobacter wancherniae NBRC 103581]